MTQVRIDHGSLGIEFIGWERLMVRRHLFVVPVTAITRVEVLDGWTSETLGARVGLVVSGLIKVGTFVHPSGVRRLVSMRQGLPLLRVTLSDRGVGNGFDELLVSTGDAPALAAVLSAGQVRSS